MAQDFAKKNKNYPKATSANKKVSKTKNEGSSKRFFLLFFVVSIIVTCCIFIYVQNGMVYNNKITENAKSHNNPVTFEFYKILPNMKVEKIKEKSNGDLVSSSKSFNNKPNIKSDSKVQDLNPPVINQGLQNKKEDNIISKNNIVIEKSTEKSVEKKLEKKDKLKHSSLNDKSYFLQLASFKDYKDADNLRAKLILSGIDVDIYKAKLGKDTTWFRVRSKKSHDYQKVEDLRNKLLAFKIKAIILNGIG